MMLSEESAIRQRAYEIWQAEGGVHGHDLAHWLSAQEEVRQAKAAKPQRRRSASGASPRRRKAAA